jgi:hypothetical protein
VRRDTVSVVKAGKKTPLTLGHFEELTRPRRLPRVPR